MILRLDQRWILRCRLCKRVYGLLHGAFRQIAFAQHGHRLRWKATRYSVLEQRYAGAPVRGTSDGSDPQIHSAVLVGKVFGTVNNQSTAVSFVALLEWLVHIVNQ